MLSLQKNVKATDGKLGDAGVSKANTSAEPITRRASQQLVDEGPAS